MLQACTHEIKVPSTRCVMCRKNIKLNFLFVVSFALFIVVVIQFTITLKYDYSSSSSFHYCRSLAQHNLYTFCYASNLPYENTF